MKIIEYRVRPVTRYIVTRFHQEDEGMSGVDGCGEFSNVGSANRICAALAATEDNAKAFLAMLHASDCAVHNAPAYPEGQCDCPARSAGELVD